MEVHEKIEQDTYAVKNYFQKMIYVKKMEIRFSKFRKRLKCRNFNNPPSLYRANLV